VARSSEELVASSGARGTERTRTITFDADSRAVMITVATRADGLVRIDGWLAPVAALRVELRLLEPEPPRIVTADEAGRFTFDGVPHGMAQLLVYQAAGLQAAGLQAADEAAPRVITPAFSL
jgi:hypothetical protein